jgi:hypothetical protein
MAREWYAVRVRECIVPPRLVEGKWTSGRYIKKTHIYHEQGPKEAGQKYKGNGLIMHVRKVSRDRVRPKGGLLPGIGGFLKLGDQLLQELNEGGTLLEQAEINKEKRRYRILTKNMNRGSNGE